MIRLFPLSPKKYCADASVVFPLQHCCINSFAAFKSESPSEALIVTDISLLPCFNIGQRERKNQE